MTKNFTLFTLLVSFTVLFSSCGDDDEGENFVNEDPATFAEIGEIMLVGGEGAAEISAFDPATNLLFVQNNSTGSTIDIVDLSDPTTPNSTQSINITGGGGINSVAVGNGLLAVALEADNTQDNGVVIFFNTTTLEQVQQVTVGALPDMVTFTPDASLVVVANEGEPSDDYTNDPVGSVSIITVSNFNVQTLDFASFNGDETALEAEGLRVFGPNATLAQDVEPEFVTISDDSRTAWVSLQENNGIARVDLTTATITDIFPLGFKDFSVAGNEIDASDEDGTVSLASRPVLGIYQPDAIAYFSTGSAEYIVTANEGDAREYDAFEEEERIADVTLDPTNFPDAATLQEEANLGRLKITNTLGNTDGDDEFEVLYAYGARSFSIWDANDGELVFDSGNDIEERVINNSSLYPDNRSDDKGVEPEGVAVGNVGGRTIAFIGLERADAVVVYDITNPTSPQYLQLLEVGDAPEGIVFVSAADSPTGGSLLIVSSEDDGVVKIFQPSLIM
ncbi:MAG: choice-of-anchor I family protein [Bacteroidota bacterium]